VTRRGAYSALAVLNLALHLGERLRKSREIAEETNTPRKYLPQILANLKRHGFVNSTAGPKGGYSLSRPPGEINLLEVIEAAEGSLQSTECGLCEGGCDWEPPCPLHDVWARGRDALVAELASTSFAELARSGGGLEVGSRRPVSGPPSRRRGRRGGPHVPSAPES
jgi:Rrf2 family iron-sulfur cluster assembly transcriptional regulator